MAIAAQDYTVAVKDGKVVSCLGIVLVASGDINGIAVHDENTEITDVASLYTFMATRDLSQSRIEDGTYFLAVADINGDGSIDVYDLHSAIVVDIGAPVKAPGLSLYVPWISPLVRYVYKH